ncbi:MAG: response regulator [Anaerolineae bacterium]
MTDKGSEDRIRVLLADDHTLFRQGLRQILQMERDIRVVGEVGNGEEAVEKASTLRPDVIVMDINMPQMDGVQATKLITEKEAKTAIIILTMYRQDEYVFEAIKAGARGYFLKDADASEVIDGIRAVHRGEALVDPAMALKVLEEFRRLAEEPPPVQELDALTEREIELLRLVAKGASNKEIAQRLFLAEKTVKNQMSVIFQKLHTNNRTEAAMTALRRGLISLDELEQ